MKGIILAGGSGTRLYPMTLTVSKQLLPVYDKPMIYYPISVLLLAGITEILIISTPRDLAGFRALLGTGERWGIRFSYAEQPRPEGIAQALIIAEDFLAGLPSALILGDNIFFGHGLPELLMQAKQEWEGASIFTYRVSDPSRYGVVTFDDSGKATAIDEKPTVPRSNWAVTGLYLYDETASLKARALKPSIRGELEITDLNQLYLDEGRLAVVSMGRGFAWFDTGTPDSLLEAAEFVRTLDHRQSFKICCPEEIALARGLIDEEKLMALGLELGKSQYGAYLQKIAREAQAYA